MAFAGEVDREASSAKLFEEHGNVGDDFEEWVDVVSLVVHIATFGADCRL